MSYSGYPFYWGIFLCLLGIFLVSSLIFWILAMRDTAWRPGLRLHDWADDRGFSLMKDGRSPLPEALAPLGAHAPYVEMTLTGGESILLRASADLPPSRRADDGRRPLHILLRRSGGDWRPAALRPANAALSLRDYFPMEDYPSVLTPERFIAAGADRRAAATLAASAAVRLLPPDIGLILIGPNVILDFSARAFDSIEFDRMLAIGDQLIRQLPATAELR